MEFFINVIGGVGAGAILFCFIANLAGRLNSSSRLYLYLNLPGGILVAVNSFWFSVYPALVINLPCSLASFVRLARRSHNEIKI